MANVDAWLAVARLAMSNPIVSLDEALFARLAGGGGAAAISTPSRSARGSRLRGGGKPHIITGERDGFRETDRPISFDLDRTGVSGFAL